MAAVPVLCFVIDMKHHGEMFIMLSFSMFEWFRFGDDSSSSLHNEVWGERDREMKKRSTGREWVVWKSQTCIEIYKVTTCKTGQPMFKLQSSTCKSDIQHISTGFRLNGDGSIFRVCVCVYLVWMFVKVNQFVHRKIWNSKDKTFPIFDKNSVGTRADKQQCDLMTVSGFESHSLSLSFCSFFRLNFSAYSIYLNFIWFGRWM